MQDSNYTVYYLCIISACQCFVCVVITIIIFIVLCWCVLLFTSMCTLRTLVQVVFLRTVYFLLSSVLSFILTLLGFWKLDFALWVLFGFFNTFLFLLTCVYHVFLEYHIKSSLLYKV